MTLLIRLKHLHLVCPSIFDLLNWFDWLITEENSVRSICITALKIASGPRVFGRCRNAWERPDTNKGTQRHGLSQLEQNNKRAREPLTATTGQKSRQVYRMIFKTTTGAWSQRRTENKGQWKRRRRNSLTLTSMGEGAGAPKFYRNITRSPRLSFTNHLQQ